MKKKTRTNGNITSPADETFRRLERVLSKDLPFSDASTYKEKERRESRRTREAYEKESLHQRQPHFVSGRDHVHNGQTVPPLPALLLFFLQFLIKFPVHFLVDAGKEPIHRRGHSGSWVQGERPQQRVYLEGLLQNKRRGKETLGN